MALVSSKQVETNRAELIVEVKGEQFSQAVDAAFRKNSKKISLPGFRRGKAPRTMIERAYGKGVFYEDAMNDLYPRAYSEALKESGFDAVDAADIEVLDLGDDGFSFKATVTTRPIPEMGEYNGIEAVKKIDEVTDEEIDKQLDEMREKCARVAIVERGTQNGDIVDIDFEGFVDGVAFDGGKGEHYSLTIGSNTFIPGFEEQIIGHTVGEEFDVSVAFPADYAEETLAGKPSIFKVKIHEVKEKQLPELDDEFAKDVSEFNTLAEYKDDLRKTLAERNEQNARAAFENQLMDAVVDGMKVEIPQCMIDQRVNELVQDFANRLSQQGLKVEDFIRYTGEGEDKFKESFVPQAERQVKARLAMETIAKKEELNASEEEVNEEYKKIAEAYKAEEDQVRSYIPQRELAMDIGCRKALEFVVSHGKIVAEKLEELKERADEVAAQVKDAMEKKAETSPEK